MDKKNIGKLGNWGIGDIASLGFVSRAKTSLFFGLFFCCFITFSQPVAQQRCDAFKKGMNLSNWLEAYWQPNYPTPDGYTRNDLLLMKAAGIKSIRLPIGFASVTDTLFPYAVDTANALFTRVDTVMAWCAELDMNLIIDNHHQWDIFNGNWRYKIDRFAHLWAVVAKRYKNSDPERYTFELLNEPAFGIALDSLNIVFNHAIDSVRRYTTSHSIIVSPNFSSNGAAFANLTPFADTNLIYTWHSYDPYQFTHQGFSWASPPMPLGETFPGSFDHGLYNAWSTVANWQATYHKPVFLGEFGTGVFGDAASRCNWIEVFGSKIDSLNMPWFYWDWRWDFSLFHSHTISEDSVIDCFKHSLHLYGDTLLSPVNELRTNEFSISLSPNPASTGTGCMLSLSEGEEAILTIYDRTSRRIFLEHFTYATAIPVQLFQPGLYLLEVRSRNKVARRKLVIE